MDANESVVIDFGELKRIAGSEVLGLIVQTAPTKVLTRVGKAETHVAKAIKLQGLDDEMGVIRYIAAEEELVVALFEWLKLNADHVPAHRDFASMRNNHRVKLAFTPVLNQIASVAEEWLVHGIVPEGMEGFASWSVRPKVKAEKVVLSLHAEDGTHLIDISPLQIAITTGDMPDDATVEALCQDFFSRIKERCDGASVKSFVTERADFRNKLLYADDGQAWSMAETLEELRTSFERDLRRLLWSLATLLTNKPLSAEWGVLNQFISVYRRVLTEAKVLRP